MRQSKSNVTSILRRDVKRHEEEIKSHEPKDILPYVADLQEDIFQEHREFCNTEREEQWMRNFINLLFQSMLFEQ